MSYTVPSLALITFGFWEMLLVFGVLMLLFGAKKLRTIGSDLGAAVKGFKKAMNEGDTEETTKQITGDKKPDADFSSQESQKSETGSSKNA